MIFGICALAFFTASAAENTARAKTSPIQKTVASSADIKDIARAKMDQIQKAVVTVRTIIKIKYPGMRGASMMGGMPNTDMKSEVIGTVIDPDGLIVTDMSLSSSLSSIYESDMMGGLDEMPGIGGMRGGASGVGGMRGGRPSAAKPQVLKEMSIILDDGAEMPAEVVLKDSDLGLTFVQPRDASRKFEAIQLKPVSQQPKLLDSIFAVGRLGKNDGRAFTLSLDSIQAIVTKGSNAYYVSEKGNSSLMGCIAFSSKGEPIGVYAMKEQPKGLDLENYNPMDEMEEIMGGMGGSRMPLIIRSINDVFAAAQKAKKQKTP
jgi:hypothetical protein